MPQLSLLADFVVRAFLSQQCFADGFHSYDQVQVLQTNKDMLYIVCVVVLVFFFLFRYIRFFPDGHVMMLTTPEEPQSIVPRLRTRNTRQCFYIAFWPVHIFRFNLLWLNMYDLKAGTGLGGSLQKPFPRQPVQQELKFILILVTLCRRVEQVVLQLSFLDYSINYDWLI